MLTETATAPVLASPVVSAVRVLEPTPAPPDGAGDGADPTAVTTITITPDEPVFAGHYPDFPIFPGICIVECVHRSALATAPGGVRLRLAAVESARFRGPVYPGDRIQVGIRWRSSGAGWTCVARVDCARYLVAQVRLRYRLA